MRFHALGKPLVRCCHHSSRLEERRKDEDQDAAWSQKAYKSTTGRLDAWYSACHRVVISESHRRGWQGKSRHPTAPHTSVWWLSLDLRSTEHLPLDLEQQVPSARHCGSPFCCASTRFCRCLGEGNFRGFLQWEATGFSLVKPGHW